MKSNDGERCIFCVLNYQKNAFTNFFSFQSAFFAGFILSIELKNVIQMLQKMCGFQPMNCSDDMLFYTAFLNEEGVPVLSDSAIFNSLPEKIVHQVRQFFEYKIYTKLELGFLPIVADCNPCIQRFVGEIHY